MVLRVLPLRSSPAPIGYIYDATPDADGGLLAAALAFFSYQGHQVFHDPCPDLAAYRWSRGVVSSVVPVDRLPDHILSSGLELLDGLFAPSPTDSGTAFMAAYLVSPPSATPQLPSGNRSVASGLGSTRGVGSVMGSVGVHVQSSAQPLGGPGVPGGTSAPLVGLPGRRPDPDDGVTAPGCFHPDLGIPTSLGDVGVHPGVSGLDMGGLGVPFARGQSQSVMGGTGVSGGASVLHGGNVGCRPDPDKGVPSPACSYHASGPRPLASPRSLCGSPIPSSVVVSASHPSHCGASLPSSVSFSGRSGDHSGACSSVGGHQGGRSSSSSSGPRGGTLGRSSSSIYSIPSALRHRGSESLVGDESNWAESTLDDISLSPIPLPVDKFTLPPIKSGEDYLKLRDLILFWLRSPGFSMARNDSGSPWWLH